MQTISAVSQLSRRHTSFCQCCHPKLPLSDYVVDSRCVDRGVASGGSGINTNLAYSPSNAHKRGPYYRGCPKFNQLQKDHRRGCDTVQELCILIYSNHLTPVLCAMNAEWCRASHVAPGLIRVRLLIVWLTTGKGCSIRQEGPDFRKRTHPNRVNHCLSNPRRSVVLCCT
jgi:hypothetical protein